MKIASAILFLSLAISGCAQKQTDVPSIGEIGSGVSAMRSILDVANKCVDKAIEAAKGNDVAKAYMGAAKDAINSAQDKSVEVQATVEKAQKEAEAAKRSYSKLDESHQSLSAKWYVKWGKRIERAFTVICIYVGLMYAMRIAALFFPAGNAIGGVLSVVSTAMNPGAWLNSVADNIWFRKLAKKEEHTEVQP